MWSRIRQAVMVTEVKVNECTSVCAVRMDYSWLYFANVIFTYFLLYNLHCI